MKWFLDLFRRKNCHEELQPDATIIIDLYKDAGQFIFTTSPEDLSNEDIVDLIDIAANLLETQNPGVSGVEDIEKILTERTSPPKLKRVK